MKNLFFIFLSLLLFISCSSDSDEGNEMDTMSPTVDFSIAGFNNVPDNQNIVVSNQIVISIDAQDDNGIAKVEAFIDNQKVGEDNTSPYEITIDVSNLASKNQQTGKFTDYTLIVVVTDTSGNTSSKEQVFNVDNELPVISEVSLVADTAINGDINTVTFDITDNEILKEVKTYVNDDLLSEITDSNYEVNINTLSLQDGENTLKIEALDLADNLASFEVEFISDNTGPEIVIPNLEEDSVLDDSLTIVPEIFDEYSDVLSFEVRFRGEELTSFENPTDVAFDFNPEDYSVGPASFDFAAIDGLGNESTLSINSEILRLLMEVQIPEGFLSPFWTSFWIFANNLDDGSLIASRSVQLGEETVQLYAPEEFDADSPYMITYLAVEDTPDGDKSRVTTVQDITRNTLNEIIFKSRQDIGGQSQNINTNGFGPVEFVDGFGAGYGVSHFPSEQNPNMSIFDRNDDINREYYYLYSNQLEGIDYAYFKLPTAIEENFVLNRSDMISDLELSTPTFTIENALEFNFPILNIFGYDSPQDFNDEVFHQIYSQTPPLVFGGEYQYQLNTSFSNYSHTLSIGDYYTERKSLPLDNYVVPDWTISSTQAANTISLEITGNDHRLGRVLLRPTTGDSYVMTILFDSQNTTQIVFPQIPDELSNLNFYNALQQGTLNVEQVQITSLDNISSYEEYLSLVVKNQNENNEISNTIESKLNVTGGFVNFENFHFD